MARQPQYLRDLMARAYNNHDVIESLIVDAPEWADASDDRIAAAPALLAELRETELNLTQTLIAVTIGRESAQKRLAFVLRELERVRDRHSALFATIDGTHPIADTCGNLHAATREDCDEPDGDQ